MYDSLLISKNILELYKNDKKFVTPMQLIKLVYLCHGWMLGLYNKPILKEDVEAWKYGLVIPNLYREIKKYKSHPVEEIKVQDNSIDGDSLDIIKQVYQKYGHFTGIELSMLTHQKDSPWDLAVKNGNTVISNDLIAYYYNNLAKD